MGIRFKRKLCYIGAVEIDKWNIPETISDFAFGTKKSKLLEKYKLSGITNKDSEFLETAKNFNTYDAINAHDYDEYNDFVFMPKTLSVIHVIPPHLCAEWSTYDSYVDSYFRDFEYGTHFENNDVAIQLLSKHPAPYSDLKIGEIPNDVKDFINAIDLFSNTEKEQLISNLRPAIVGVLS